MIVAHNPTLVAAVARHHFRRALERDALWRRYDVITEEDRAAGRYASAEGNAVLKRWAWAERRARHLRAAVDPAVDLSIGSTREPIEIGPKKVPP